MDDDLKLPCPSCKKLTPVQEFFREGGRTRPNCRACRAKNERASLKKRVFDAYGNRCACCGLEDIRFLVLDHVNNDGFEERKTMKCHQTYQKAVREDFPPCYQLLCANCNMGKQIYGKCPHQIDAEVIGP